ncbi:MAG: GNAT family N-acetyltransferase [Actinomycetota bacterium]|nr:GNAT family N-acetyltransferase [Actinomycetota bacterium]
MRTDLPAGYRWRRPTPDDAKAIFDLVAARNTAILGFADLTLDDVSDELVEPGFDREADGWLVDDDSGALVGWGWAFRNGDSDLVNVDVLVGDHAEVAGWLWERVLERAAAIGAELGHARVDVDIGIYRDDEGQRAAAAVCGFSAATTFQRMRIDFDGAPAEPDTPDGVVVRTGPGDEAFRRQGHMVSQDAFAEHFGFVARSFEEWHEAVEAQSSHDWSQLRVAHVDGEAVAMVRGSDQFVEDEGCGYIPTVAVLPAARGRGLAKLLLRQAFADDFRRGRKGTILHVDTNNVTPALDLYLGVGMRPVLVIDMWRYELPTGAGAVSEPGGG